MRQMEINHALTAYNCAISVLRGFVAMRQADGALHGQQVQHALDLLRDLEEAIADWQPTPDKEGD